jgi:hypothetical protein
MDVLMSVTKAPIFNPSRLQPGGYLHSGLRQLPGGTLQPASCQNFGDIESVRWWTIEL